MSSDRELLAIGGVELNDGSSFDMEGLTFTPAAKKPQWASNAGADGDALVQEAHFGNSTFDIQLRVVPQATTKAALEKVGDLLDAIQSCERLSDGAEVKWTPNNTETTWTAYGLLAELVEVPIEVQGDMAGWLLNAPVIKLRITCRPFLYKAETTAKAATESGAEPQQTLYVKCGGDVPAEVRVKVTDKSSQSRRFLEYGRDVVFSEEGNPGTLIVAASLVTTNFTGEAKTRSGAYSEEKVKRAVAVGEPTVMCGTGAIKNVGSFKIYARVYAASELARFRMSYRNGEGPLVPLAFVQPPILENFSRIYLGEVTFDEAELGTQKSEIRIEAKSSDGTPIEVDLNFLELIPSTKGSARVRGRANNTPSKLLAYDTFLQTEGTLAGKTLPLGGEWTGAGDADQFTVIAAEDLARRTAVSDANLNTGRYAIAGSEEPTSSKASVKLYGSLAGGGAETIRRGVFLRYSSTNKWLMAVIGNKSGTADYWTLKVIKRTAEGSVTTLGETLINATTPQFTDTVVSLSAAANGTWSASWYPASETSQPAPLISGQDADLATGGTLASGKGGFYDAWTSGSGLTRNYDNFTLLSAEPADVMLYSGKTAEWRSDGYLRQDSTGTYYGEFPPRGGDIYLEPEGESGAINRLVIVARRNDVEVEADSAVTDKTSVEVLVRERFLAPRG